MCKLNEQKFTFITSLTVSVTKPVFPKTDSCNLPAAVQPKVLAAYARALNGKSVCIETPTGTFDLWRKLEAAAWALLKNVDGVSVITGVNVNDSRPTDIKGEWASSSGRSYVHPVTSVVDGTRYIAVCDLGFEGLWLMASVEAVFDPDFVSRAALESLR